MFIDTAHATDCIPNMPYLCLHVFKHRPIWCTMLLFHSIQFHLGRSKANAYTQNRNNSISSTSYAKTNRRAVPNTAKPISSDSAGTSSNPSADSICDPSATLQRCNGRNYERNGNNYTPRSDRFATRNVATTNNSDAATSGAGIRSKIGANIRGNGGPSAAASGYRRRLYNPRYYNGTTRSTFRIHRTEATSETVGNHDGDGSAVGDTEQQAVCNKPSFNEGKIRPKCTIVG